MNELAINLIQIAGLALLAILFLQSGLDKIVDFKGNLTWMKGHFAQTMFKNLVPSLLMVITLIEISAGFFSALSVALFMLPEFHEYAVLSGMMGSANALLALICLFFGQRVAKDYAGAASLVPYFLVSGLTLFVVSL